MPHLLFLRGKHVDDVLLPAAALRVQHVTCCPAGTMRCVGNTAAACPWTHIGVSLHDVYHVHDVLPMRLHSIQQTAKAAAKVQVNGAL